jgi:hypothetical protein
VPTDPLTVPPGVPAAFTTRRTAAGVTADRRSPEGLGLDTGEDRRILTTAGTTPRPTADHRHNAAVRAVMPRCWWFGRTTGPNKSRPSLTPCEHQKSHMRRLVTGRTNKPGPRQSR